jgi:hypothetical protein
LIGDLRPPLPVQPGWPPGGDYEYTRNGTANVFILSEPLEWRRHAAQKERRTNKDFARTPGRIR